MRVRRFISSGLVVVLAGALIAVLAAVTRVPSASTFVHDFRGTCAYIVLKIAANQNGSGSDAVALLTEVANLQTQADLAAGDAIYNNLNASDIEFVDRSGKTSSFNDAVGVRAKDVFHVCGRQNIHEKLDFPNFADNAAQFVIPWIALSSQLAYQTGHFRTDLWSGLISIGSPMWMAYSMGLVFCYQWNIHVTTRRMLSIPSLGFHTQIYHVRRVLKTWLQAPVRISGHQETLIELIRQPQWWLAASNHLKGSEMRFDSRLIFTSCLAAGVWIWSLASAFVREIDSQVTAVGTNWIWQVCIGILWSWMFTITSGWAAMRYQSKAGTISKSFKQNDASVLVNSAIVQRAGLIPSPLEDLRLAREGKELANLFEAPALLGFNVLDGESSQGPANAPWRFLTTWHLSKIVIESVELAYTPSKARSCSCGRMENIDNMGKEEEDLEEEKIEAENMRERESQIEMTVPEASNLPQPSPQIEDVEGSVLKPDSEPNLAQQTKNHEEGAIVAYPEWTDVDRKAWLSTLAALAFGSLVQLGSTVPSMLVMYLFPPKGFGCMAGGILIYLICAITSCALMLSSTFFHHQAMLLHQRSHLPRSRSPNAGLKSASIGYKSISAASILTRFLGRTLAVANALWITTWCLLTFTNVMHQPYCGSAYPALGDRGWIYLWNFAKGDYESTRRQEIICLACSVGVAYLACVAFVAFAAPSKDGDGWPWRKRIAGFVSALLAFLVVCVPVSLTISRSIRAKYST